MVDILYGSLALLVGTVLFIAGLILIRVKRLIENIPTSKIRSIAMGLIEIYGSVAKGEKLLKSPSNKDCVYCKYTIKKYIYSNNNGRWKTIKEGEDRVLFYLKDKTGKVLVDPTGAVVHISPVSSKPGKIEEMSPSIRSFLKSKKISLSERIWIDEYIIKPKDKVYIMGTATDNPLVKEGTSIHGAEDIMIRKGKYEKIYYISDKPEKEVLTNFKWIMFVCLFGGGAMLTYGLYSMFLLYIMFL